MSFGLQVCEHGPDEVELEAGRGVSRAVPSSPQRPPECVTLLPEDRNRTSSVRYQA